MESAHSKTIEYLVLSWHLNECVHGVLENKGKVSMDNTISQIIYTRCVIKPVNRIKDKDWNQKQRCSTDLIKVSGLSHKRVNKMDPCLAWIMFHKIANMQRYLKHKEEDSPLLPLEIADKMKVKQLRSIHIRCATLQMINQVSLFNIACRSPRIFFIFNPEALRFGIITG